ncbi:MAG: hypothetical protein E6J20_18115 [Chloroflexi bacterium]|nr:MAG: hypothetical protein E6J20_18115 [Chloroflexota bacterium]
MHQTDAPGCHACGTPPLFQWTRLATATEAEKQKAEIARLQGRELTDAEIAARYGPLRIALTGCAAHHLGDVAGDADSGLDRRALLHAADCGGHGACVCDETDPADGPSGA